MVDGGSQDGARELSLEHGAKVVVDPRRGYGIPLRTGLGVAAGDLIVTSGRRPLLPRGGHPDLLRVVAEEDLDFLTTDRFSLLDSGSMSRRNLLGNRILSFCLRRLFCVTIRDSQSGMWIIARRPCANLG